MKTLFFALLLVCQSAFANPTVFGITIGKTTVEQLKNQYRVSPQGINKYSEGEMYVIPQGQIQFDGLGEVTVIFDRSDRLVAVLTEFPKNKFDYLNGMLANKYQLISQNIPFVGNKSATYRNDDTEITLDAPHLSFELSMNYIHSDFMKAFNSQTQKEKQQKQQQESSML